MSNCTFLADASASVHRSLVSLFLIVSVAASASAATPETATPALAYTTGPFEPNLDSLRRYSCPEWFRDAKFGIWAHWGPQSQPENGDWYARNLYIEGSPQNQYHLKTYGHPSTFGFKDICHLWKAEKFDPEALVSFYKKNGARYFVALAVHHDNFDLWNSRFQPWNSVNMGPRRDLVAAWASAARAAGLPFGLTVHARSAWTWYEVAQLSDKAGPFRGVPYDGNLTKADGKGAWWEGYDPQDLYEQRHTPSRFATDREKQRSNPGEAPSVAFRLKLYNRVQDLLSQFHPELLYFDDTLTWFGTKAYSLSITAGAYNDSLQRHQGENRMVVNFKALTAAESRCLVNDIEAGAELDIKDVPWQVDACLGNWFYQRGRRYVSAERVIRGLCDVVSKNGNLLLSVPVRGDGSIDEEARKIVSTIGQWLSVNGEGIYGTRPWFIYGEGPATHDPLAARKKGGMKVFRSTPYSCEDIRFTQKNGILYAIALDWPPGGELKIKSLAQGTELVGGEITRVSLLGSGKGVRYERTREGLTVQLPERPCDVAYVLRIEGLSPLSRTKFPR